MEDQNTIKCPECGKEFTKLDSLRKHRSMSHKISSEQTYIEFVLNGVEPKCKCGCDERPTFLGFNTGYRDYLWGHAARINNNWGHNPEVVRKSHETQKKMYNSGELQIWNKGLTMEDDRVKNNVLKGLAHPDRSKKISKKLKGVKKTEEHKNSLRESAKKSWTPDKRKKQSDRRIKILTENNHKNKKTKLEFKFEKMLDELNINYVFQKQVSNAIFDFFIFNKQILIEVDGDFHHCNPNSKHSKPKYPIQIKTVNNDIRKNNIALDHGYKLLRFWESDINNDPEKVISILKEELK